MNYMVTRSLKNMFLGCYLVAMSACTFAQEFKGISFSHQEWEIYCSNTGTCKAAGYQNDDDTNPASLLLTRKAGPQQPIIAEFALSDHEHNMPANKLKHIHFYLNGKDLGAVALDGFEVPLMGKLSNQQVHDLLQQSNQKTSIIFKNTHYQWNISDAGMTAVLLKMDDFQKRVGTVGALVKKGNADESGVLVALPKLIVQHVKTANTSYLTLHPKSKQYEAVYRILIAAQPNLKDDNSCEGAYDETSDDAQPQIIELYKLSKNKVLAKTLCWRAAYNEGYGIWVLDDSLTGKATFITESASHFDSGIITSTQKGRGIGDCWLSEKWVWNGEQFVQTRDMWTGACKDLAAGGVWYLDKIASVVLPPR